jgi:membrane protease YdiL (CAAX protease family)
MSDEPVNNQLVSDHTSLKPVAQNFFTSINAGAWALIEFLVAVSTAVLSSHWLRKLAYGNERSLITGALRITVVVLLVLFIVHTVVVIMRRRWDTWFSVLAILLIYFLSQGIGQLLVSLFLAFRGYSITAADQLLQNSVTTEFFYVLLAEILTVGGVIGYLKLFRVPLSSIGLKKPRWVDLLWGIGSVIPYFVAYAVILSIVSRLIPSLNVNEKQQLGFNDIHGIQALTLTFISLVVLPPIAEEIAVRGLLYSSLKKSLSFGVALIVTSLIFASAHLPEGGSAGPLYVAFIDTFVLSLFLVAIRRYSGRLYGGMTLHAIKNGIAFVALYLVHTHS